IALDEEVARKLEAEMRAEMKKEERMPREKDEENRAVIKEQDDVWAIINSDRQLAEQIQAQEREQLSIEERSKLLAELIESRRKYFAAKRAEENRNKPPTKEQAKVADDDTAELKRCLEIIPEDDDDVAVEATPLSYKSPTINFNKEDLEVLRSIVKERFKKTNPVDDMENILSQTLKTMFEPHVKDIIWKYRQGAVNVNN
nr:hypothetical protein [Tanacetum cinerariifolium]